MPSKANISKKKNRNALPRSSVTSQVKSSGVSQVSCSSKTRSSAVNKAKSSASQVSSTGPSQVSSSGFSQAGSSRASQASSAKKAKSSDTNKAKSSKTSQAKPADANKVKSSDSKAKSSKTSQAKFPDINKATSSDSQTKSTTKALPDLLAVKVLSLNCNDARFVSSNRVERIKSIGEHIIAHKYDVVMLQELWIKCHFDYLQKILQPVLPFACWYNNPSFAGNSGLAIFVKFSPRNIDFRQYSVNGSTYHFWSLDSYVGKGVAYMACYAESLGVNLHIFNSHFLGRRKEVKNKENKLKLDMKTIHREVQIYECSRFIHSKINNIDNAGLVLLGATLNTTTDEEAYKHFKNLTHLRDCFAEDSEKSIQPTKSNNVNQFATYNHPSNTIRNCNSDVVRIDYIFMRYIMPKTASKSTAASQVKVNKIVVDGLDTPGGKSISDHQPVVVSISKGSGVSSSDISGEKNQNAAEIKRSIARMKSLREIRQDVISYLNKERNKLALYSALLIVLLLAILVGLILVLDLGVLGALCGAFLFLVLLFIIFNRWLDTDCCQTAALRSVLDSIRLDLMYLSDRARDIK